MVFENWTTKQVQTPRGTSVAVVAQTAFTAVCFGVCSWGAMTAIQAPVPLWSSLLVGTFIGCCDVPYRVWRLRQRALSDAQ